MSERTPEKDINIPGHPTSIPSADKKEGRVHAIRSPDEDVKDGLFVTNKYDLVNPEEDEEEKNDDEKGPIFSDHQINTGLAVLNTFFGAILVLMMNLPGTDGGPEIAVVIVIGSLMALTSSVSFVWFLTCHMDTQTFHDAIFNHIEDKQKTDPAFKKLMQRGWFEQERRYVPDREQFLDDLAVQEAEKDKPGPHNLGGSQISDGEDIIEDDDDDVDGDTGTQTGESSPTAGGRKAYIARSDPTKTSGGAIEMTKVVVSTRPHSVPDIDAEPSQGILKKQESLPKDKKDIRQVSFASSEQLFQTPARAQEFQKEADLVALKEEEETFDEEKNEHEAPPAEVEPETESNQTEIEETASSEQNDDETDNEEMGAISFGPDTDDEEDVDQHQAPEDFYDQLFSAAYLKVSFRKYKQAVQNKVPNGFDLDGMDQKELSDIIPSRLIRKRILTEASRLATKIKTSGPKSSDHRDPTRTTQTT